MITNIINITIITNIINITIITNIITIIRPPLSAQPSHYLDSWRCCCTPAFPTQRSRSGTSTTCKDGGHKDVVVVGGVVHDEYDNLSTL